MESACHRSVTYNWPTIRRTFSNRLDVLSQTERLAYFFLPPPLFAFSVILPLRVYVLAASVNRVPVATASRERLAPALIVKRYCPDEGSAISPEKFRVPSATNRDQMTVVPQTI